MQENVALKNMRLLRRKTQREMASIMGVSEVSYRSYERADVVIFPRVDQAIRAAEFLSCGVEEIFMPDNVRETDNDDAGEDN